MIHKGSTGIGGNEDLSASRLMSNVVLLSQRMLDAARANQWDVVSEFESDRKNMLSECFAKSIPAELSNEFAQALAAILHMNEELIGLLEAAKANVAIKRSDQIHTKRSLGHYLDIEQSH